MANNPKKEFILDDSTPFSNNGGGSYPSDKFRELGRNNYAIFIEKTNKFDRIREIEQIPRRDVELPKIGEKGYHSVAFRTYSLGNSWQFSEKALEAVMDDKTNPFIFARGEDKKSILATLDRAFVDDIIYRDKENQENAVISKEVARLAIEEIKKIDPNRYGSEDMRLSIYRVARDLKEKDPEKQMEEFKSDLASLMSSRKMVATTFANELAMRLDCYYGQYSQIKKTLMILPEGLLDYMAENNQSYSDFNPAFSDKFGELAFKKAIDLIEDAITRNKNNLVFNYDTRSDNTLKPTFLKRLYKELAKYMEPHMEKFIKASKSLNKAERSLENEVSNILNENKIFEKYDKITKQDADLSNKIIKELDDLKSQATKILDESKISERHDKLVEKALKDIDLQDNQATKKSNDCEVVDDKKKYSQSPIRSVFEDIFSGYSKDDPTLDF